MKILLATFALVFLRALQSHNVIHGNYIAAASTPYSLPVAEGARIMRVLQAGWDAIPWGGTGGMLGATLAMYIHKKARTSGN